MGSIAGCVDGFQRTGPPNTARPNGPPMQVYGSRPSLFGFQLSGKTRDPSRRRAALVSLLSSPSIIGSNVFTLKA